MHVAVFGMGYVGCVTAAVLAREGHQVTGVDTNPSKVEMLRRGEPTVLEPGLADLVSAARGNGRLTATVDATEALSAADIVIICVGTPSASSGALDTSYVERVAEQIGAGIAGHPGYPVVTIRSTVLSETIEELILPTLERASGRRAGDGFGLAVNPEFLREGSSIADFDHPQFTLIGADESRTAAAFEQLYEFLDAPMIVTDRRTASLVKYACNAFHATKVAFANEIGAVAEAAGIDGREVMRILCLDTKLNISPTYLRPGMPFGGSCLPKDVRALAHYGRRRDAGVPLLTAVLESNRLRIEACVERILAQGRARIGIFGMAFKAGTDDLRESPTVEIIERLIGKGAEVHIYDSRVSLARLVGANREYLAQHVPHVARLLRPTLNEVADAADVLVIANNDEEFRGLPDLMRPGQRLVDLVGMLPPDATSRDARRGVA